MSQFTVNGKEVALNIPPQTPLKEVIDHLLKKMTNDQTAISSIRVNGMELGTELTPIQERDYGSIPIADLETIDVVTTFSRELIDDTLHHLLQYSTFLANLSTSASSLVGPASLAQQKEFHLSFRELVDGVTTFSDGISSIRQMLQISDQSKAGLRISELELELLNLLRGLFSAYRMSAEEKATQPHSAGGVENELSASCETICQILKERLPTHLTAWRNEGIPAMIWLSSS
jgi:hypothetical protein